MEIQLTVEVLVLIGVWGNFILQANWYLSTKQG